MPAVAPIGIQEAERAELFSGLRRRAEIGQRVVMPPQQRLPGGSSGANIKRHPRAGKLCGFVGKRMIRFIAPIQRDKIFFRQRAN